MINILHVQSLPCINISYKPVVAYSQFIRPVWAQAVVGLASFMAGLCKKSLKQALVSLCLVMSAYVSSHL